MKRTHPKTLGKSAKIRLPRVPQQEELSHTARVDGKEARSNGLNRKYGRGLLFVDGATGPDGKTVHPLSFARRSLVNWLNGWQPAADFLLELWDEESRRRWVDRCHGGNIEGKQEGVDDWNPESRDRIVKLLAWVQDKAAEALLKSMVTELHQMELQYNVSLKDKFDYWEIRKSQFSNQSKEYNDIVARQATLAQGGAQGPVRLDEEVGASVQGADEFICILGESMKRYAVYPGLALHMRSKRFAVYQIPFDSEQRRYVELTAEEKAETSSRKRWNYSLGPGVQFPPMTAEEKENPALWHERVEALATHKMLPPETPYGEVQAAHAICDLARFGDLRRIRQCCNSVCKTWFYAGKSNRYACSPACRAAAQRARDAEAKNKREAQEAAKLLRKAERASRRQSTAADRVRRELPNLLEQA